MGSVGVVAADVLSAEGGGEAVTERELKIVGWVIVVGGILLAGVLQKVFS